MPKLNLDFPLGPSRQQEKKENNIKFLI